MDANRRKFLRAQIKRYQKDVERILLEQWDPIRIQDELTPQDEYDSYVLGICGILIRDEGKERLFDRLWQIETVQMGLSGTPAARERTLAVVDRLMELRDRLEAQS